MTEREIADALVENADRLVRLAWQRIGDAEADLRRAEQHAREVRQRRDELALGAAS